MAASPLAQCSYKVDQQRETGWQFVHLDYRYANGSASATFTPDVGANLLQFQVNGIEYLNAFQDTPSGPASLAGTPILYPSPNRIRGAQFTFDGQLYCFIPNKGIHHAHGLVRFEPWQWEAPVVVADGIATHCCIRFRPGTCRFDQFPIHNTLHVTYTLRANSLTITMRVHNEDEQQRLPFGLAIHPFFPLHGARHNVQLQVPAQKWMEAIDRLPTGRLLDMDKGPADVRQPTALDTLNLDHVVWGMVAAEPTVITYHEINKRLLIYASEFFTHAVIFTPRDEPYFCFENQSCSTDAHNLFAHGYLAEAHLAILEPGSSLATWIKFQIEDM